MKSLMPVDIVELALKIPAINSSMKEEFMACKHDFCFNRKRGLIDKYFIG